MIEEKEKVLKDKEELKEDLKEGEIKGDFIEVVSYKGKKENGMKEMKKMMKVMGIIKDRGKRVEIVKDGSM